MCKFLKAVPEKEQWYRIARCVCKYICVYDYMHLKANISWGHFPKISGRCL